MKVLRILGTRGVPAAHGGFETFAEHLALYLVSHNWKVIVYCQEEGLDVIYTDVWEGIERVHIPVVQKGSAGTIIFDWKATRHAAQFSNLCLTLGYNTAVFCTLLRLKGVPNLINMDGVEWKRQKWGYIAKIWFWLNDWAGCWLGNHLIADHPKIKEHLATRVNEKKITMIPYGADLVDKADVALIEPYELSPQSYAILIARAEPENSILEVVRAWSQKPLGVKLVILGNYDSKHLYQSTIRSVASDEVIFLGAIYEKCIVQALRFHSLLYIHGHQVGGTNPSLVESLGAGNAVLAHDNPFNRWVAGDNAEYFSDENSCVQRLEKILVNPQLLTIMGKASKKRYDENFTWDKILSDYEKLLSDWSPV